MANYDAYFRNFSTLDSIYEGMAHGGNWVVPNAEGADYPTIDGYLYYLDYTTQKLVETSTTIGTQNIVDSHQLVWNCTKALTPDEVVQVEHNPDLMNKVWFDGATLVGGFAKVDIGNYFDPNGNTKYIQDLSIDLGSRETNYYSNIDGAENSLAVSNDIFTLDMENDTDSSWLPEVGVITASPSTECLISLTVNVTSGACYLKTLVGFDAVGGDNSITINKLLTVGTHVFSNVAYSRNTNSKVWIYLEGQNANNIYPFNSTLSYDVKEIVGYTEILGTYTSANRLQNQLTGANSLLTKNDASGRTLSTMPSGQIAVDDSGKYVASGWNIAGDDYTITQIISGLLEDLDVDGNGLGTFSQRQEFRRFVKDSLNGNSYYIEDILQGYTPTEPTGGLKAERIASIGHSDTVDTHHGEPMVYSRAVVPDPALLAWTNENDEEWIDENSETWKTN